MNILFRSFKLPFLLSLILILSIFFLHIGNFKNFQINTQNKTNEQKLWKDRFKSVLSSIKQNSIRNLSWSQQDWKKYEQVQLKNLPIDDIKKFYNCVNLALQDLKDSHSYLQPKNITQQSNQVKTNKKYEIIVENGIGIIKIPTLFAEKYDADSILMEAWVINFQKNLLQAKNSVSKGWIIDLTENDGGTMFPMLAGLSIFYEKPELGGFYSTDKSTNIIEFDGQSFSSKSVGSFYQYKSKLEINKNKLPVIVLIGSKTASSAEFLALALKRQKNIKLIGQTTAGCASGNEPIELPDDLGYIVLTCCYYLDINNEPLFEQKVKPDITLPDDKEIMYKKAIELIEQNSKIRL